MRNTLNKILKLKITIYLSILFLTSSIVSCDKSVLSDIELQDPSLIKITVYIFQDSDNELFLDVSPRDKKHRFIRLQNGAVTVNGENVSYKHPTINDLERTYRYKAKKEEVSFNITIRYNLIDSYTFRYGAEEGFPGFGTEEVKVAFPNLEKNDYFNIDGHFFEKDDIPFRKRRIYIHYKVYKKMDEM